MDGPGQPAEKLQPLGKQKRTDIFQECLISIDTFVQPHGCSQFIRAAMEAPTRADLDSIVDKQLEMVKARLTAGNATTHDAGVIKSNVLADCVVRGCVVQLLAMPSSGRDIAQKLQFLHIYAIQLATQKVVIDATLVDLFILLQQNFTKVVFQGKTIGEKKLGYLACVLLLEVRQVFCSIQNQT